MTSAHLRHQPARGWVFRSLAAALAVLGGLAAGSLAPVSPAIAQQPMQMEIVVKFKDDARVKDIIDLFWRDQAAARARFATFRASRAEFAGLRLERVTYSNELVLVPDGPPPAPAALRAMARALAASPDISYADPNMTAHTGAH
jgi:hypothetical protein